MTLPQYNWKTWDNPNYHEPPLDAWFTEQCIAWSRWIKPNDHCIDVGALTGDTTLPMAILAGPAGRVIAFEPNPNVLDITRHNCLQQSPIAPIVLVEAAADTNSGSAMFHYNASDYCNGGLLLSKRDYKVGHVAPLTVPLVPLRPFVTRLVQFIKIDTEGNDHRILASCEEELKLWHPTIQTEIYMDLTTSERLNYIDFLTGCGYTLRTTCDQPITPRQICDTEHLDIIATTQNTWAEKV